MPSLKYIVALASALLASSAVRGSDDNREQPRQETTASQSDSVRAPEPTAETAATPGDSLLSLLSLADAMPPDATSRWKNGEVRVHNQWSTPEAVSRAASTNAEQIAYRTQREKYADTAEGHLHMAQWCHAHDLAEEQRSHLLVAAQLDPSDQRPHRALGLIQRNGVWMTETELARSRDREATALKAYHEWKGRLQALRRQLASTDSQTRKDAESQLAAIRDPLAIPALEEVLSRNNEPWGLLVVDCVGQMLHKAATRSLVRHAVWHASPLVREAAVEPLQHREAEHYIGDLIHLLRTSYFGQTWTVLPNGNAALVSVAQDFERSYLTVLTVDRFGPGGRPEERPEDRRQQLQAEAESVSVRNRVRIENAMAALRQTTGEDFGADQHAWVNWWRDVSYVNPNEYSRPSRETVTRFGRIAAIEPNSHSSCFLAGTPVWTRRGMVPIDRVQLGDLVLSKNIETGELGYQPVIDRTIRRPRPTLGLEIGGETIGVTGGHPIWSPAKGWVRADEFQPGDSVCTSESTVTVHTTSEGRSDFVYNLVVAGSNTYFVGRNKILVHDITSVTDMPPAR